MTPLTKCAPSFPVTIFIAGKYHKAIKIVQKFCDDVGFCVTVKPTLYVYTNGQEHGIEVGLINYPRFPSSPSEIVSRAISIAERLREELDQDSFSIQTPHETIWRSYRKEDIREDQI